MAELTEKVDDAYRLAFGRDPDPEGLAYWQSQVESGAVKDFGQLLDSLGAGAQGEDTSAFSSGLTSQVDDIYRSAFGREADTAGQKYWEDQIAGGNIGSYQQLINSIGAGAQGDDVTAMKDAADYGTAWRSDIDPNSKLVYDPVSNKWNPQPANSGGLGTPTTPGTPAQTSPAITTQQAFRDQLMAERNKNSIQELSGLLSGLRNQYASPQTPALGGVTTAYQRDVKPTTGTPSTWSTNQPAAS